MKRKLRVLLLLHKHLVPPESVKGENLDKAPWRMEHFVLNELKNLGHEVQVLGLEDDLTPIRKSKAEFKPHIAFNLLESFDYETIFDHNVVSYLELIKLPYTGCNPKGLLISRDKGLSKKLLLYHRIKTPRFKVVPKGKKIKLSKKLQFPLIVKPLTEEGSTGISQNSIVQDEKKLDERIKFTHENRRSAAIVESFINGRELYVSIMGNKKISAFPFIELVFKDTPNNMYDIATQRVKWNEEYRKKYKIKFEEPKNISDELKGKIIHTSKRIYKILRLSGYARLDLRLSDTGQIYFIEANPNPDISKGEEFFRASKKAGYTYSEIINKILSLGLAWKPEMNYK